MSGGKSKSKMISLVKLIFGAIGSSVKTIPTATRPTLYGSFSRRVTMATTAATDSSKSAPLPKLSSI
jgi:hypothetical protein